MKTNDGSRSLYHQVRHARGISLIEALIALVVMVGGVAAIFGVHGYVVGNSAQSRLQTAAMSVAQDKLEEFRNLPFAEVLASGGGPETREIVVPGIGRDRAVNLDVCWAFDSTGGAFTDEGLVQVNLAVVRSGEGCNGAALASMSALLARQDPRIAALNTIQQERFDGDGEIVDSQTVEDYVKDKSGIDRDSSGPGGFELVRENGALIAVISSETDMAIVPRGGLVPEEGEELKPLSIAWVHGNIVFGAGEFTKKIGDDDRNLNVEATGTALCRVYYPDTASGAESVVYPNETSPAVGPPRLGPDAGPKVGYAQYTCVVADGWRRAIFPTRVGLAAMPKTERVCLGDPAVHQPGYLAPDFAEDQPAVVEADADGQLFNDFLLWPGREYLGYTGIPGDNGTFQVDTDGRPLRTPAGMRGAADGKSAVVGSVCVPGTACWEDPSLRGWVPAGHHFFIDERPVSDGILLEPGQTGYRYCAEAMSVLAEIDSALGAGHYANILARSPDRVFCTNDKEYTIALLEADQNPRPDECLSYTRVSGFISNRDVLSPKMELVANDILPVSSAAFAPGTACSLMGGFGQASGAFVCGMSERVIEPDVSFYAPDRTFVWRPKEDRIPYEKPSDSGTGTIDAIKNVEHDIVLMNFDALFRSLTVNATVVPGAAADEWQLTVSGTVDVTRVNSGEQVQITVVDENGKELTGYPNPVFSADGSYTLTVSVTQSDLQYGWLAVTASVSDKGDNVVSAETEVWFGPGSPTGEGADCDGLTVETISYKTGERDVVHLELNGIVYGGPTCGPVGDSGRFQCTLLPFVAVDFDDELKIGYYSGNGKKINRNKLNEEAVPISACSIGGVVLP